MIAQNSYAMPQDGVSTGVSNPTYRGASNPATPFSPTFNQDQNAATTKLPTRPQVAPYSPTPVSSAAQTPALTGGVTMGSPQNAVSTTQPYPTSVPSTPTPVAPPSTAPTTSPTGTGIPPVASQPGMLPTSSVLSGGTSSLAPGVSVTPTNSSNSLLGQTITPGPATDRFGIAKSQLQNYNQATDPYYQQSLREADANAAGAGQLGSGQLRTSLGNLADERNLQLETQGNSFLNNALSGSINDAYHNLGIAQQQQGFQAGLQNQTYNQGANTVGLQNTLTNSAVQNALAELGAGNAGNPADTSLILSQLFGNQAAQGGSALSSMIGNTVNRNAQTQNNSVLNGILSKLGLGGLPGATGGTTPTGNG